MLKKSLTLAVLSALACNFASAAQEPVYAAGNATGNIVFSGHVDRGSAVVMIKTADGVVDTELSTGARIIVPSVKLADLQTYGAGTARDFYIELEGYNYNTAGIMTADITLDGETLGESTDSVYKNKLSGDQAAQNVAVRLRYKGTTEDGTAQLFQDNTPLVATFNKSYGANDYAFHFDVALVAVNKDALTSGEVESTVTISINYK